MLWTKAILLKWRDLTGKWLQVVLRRINRLSADYPWGYGHEAITEHPGKFDAAPRMWCRKPGRASEIKDTNMGISWGCWWQSCRWTRIGDKSLRAAGQNPIYYEYPGIAYGSFDYSSVKRAIKMDVWIKIFARGGFVVFSSLVFIYLFLPLCLMYIFQTLKQKYFLLFMSLFLCLGSPSGILLLFMKPLTILMA